MRTERVGEPPPAVQLAEREVHPPLAAQVLERQQLARRGQEGAAVPERLFQETGRVEHVRRDHEVVAVPFETLLDRVFLDVQHPVFDRRLASAEARLRFREEARRDVRVNVVEPTRRQLRQHERRGRTRAGPDLQHAEPAPVRERFQERCDRVSQHPVRRSGPRRLHVQVGR